MLKIINDLKPFFEDCYRRVSVREYAKITNISPPTASKILALYHREGLLLKKFDRRYIFFYANRDNSDFISLSRIYWKHRLVELVSLIEKKALSPAIILFGSLSKAEANGDSDADIAVFSRKIQVNVDEIERKLKRKIQIFWFKSIKDIDNKELANSIINGYMLSGKVIL